MCSIGDVDGWGPFTPNTADCGHLSFTLLFEETLFSTLPSACWLLLVIHRIFVLSKEHVKVERTRLRIVKLVGAPRSRCKLSLDSAETVPCSF